MMKLVLIKSHGDNFQMIAELKKQISELERRTLSELPPDAQQTIQSYKDRFEEKSLQIHRIRVYVTNLASIIC